MLKASVALLLVNVAVAAWPEAPASEAVAPPAFAPVTGEAAYCVFGYGGEVEAMKQMRGQRPYPELQVKSGQLWIDLFTDLDLHGDAAVPSCAAPFDLRREHGESAEHRLAHASALVATGLALGGTCREQVDRVVIWLAYEVDRDRGGCGTTPIPSAVAMWRLAARIASTDRHRATALALAADVAWDAAAVGYEVDPWIDAALAFEDAAVANRRDARLAELAAAAWHNALAVAQDGIACTPRETLGQIVRGLARTSAVRASARSRSSR